MSISPYNVHYTASNEQNLTDSLIVEAIQHRGVNMKYIPRTHNDFDFLYGEDPTSSFDSAVEIEMYPADVQGFGGEGEIFSKFGLDIKSTATFIVAKSRFKEVFPDFIRPNEGDLMFMPFTNAILEIKFVNHESPFFNQGKQYVYELKCELFEVSHEEFDTGDSVVDDLMAGILDFDAATETDAGGDNLDLEERTETQVTFDISNPFGVK